MVFQDGVLLPHRSVLDNVALAVRQGGGRRERRAIARSWLERAEEIGDVIIAYDDGRVTGRRLVVRPTPPRTGGDEPPETGESA